MRHMRKAVIVLLACLVFAAPAFAVDAEESKKPGLLDFDPYPMVIAITVFVLVLIVLTKFAWKPILSSMKAREETIQNALDEAKAANDKAKELISQYESKLETARTEASAIADEARKDALDIKAQIEADASKTADETVARAKVEIERATAKAWDHIVRDAASIATEAASKIIGKSMTSEDHAELVSGVVDEFVAKRSAS